MAERRCSYCGRREGEGHPVRCGVTRHGFDPAYEECIDDVRAERDRYRQALEDAEQVLLMSTDIDDQDSDSTENMVFAVVSAALNQERDGA